jgi:tetratricopeptide (TPR) repeat protein
MLNKAIEIDSTFDRAYSFKSKAYSRLYGYYRDHTDSVKTLAKENALTAIKYSSVRPGFSGGNEALAVYYKRCEFNFEKALEYFDKAYIPAGREDNIYYLWQTSVVYRDLGMWDKAYELMKEVAEREPKLENARFDLATYCETMRRYEEAEENYLATIRLKPDWFSPYFRLVRMYFNWQGDTRKARELIENSWDKIDTTYWLSTLSEIAGLEGNFEGAKRPDSPEWYYWIIDKKDSARIYYKEKLDRWKGYLLENPKRPYIHNIIGWYYARLGERDSALVYIQNAYDMVPKTKIVNEGGDSRKFFFDAYVYLDDLENAVKQAEILLQGPAEFDLGNHLLDPDYKDLIKYPKYADLVRKYGNAYHKKVYEEKVGPL